MLNILSTTEKKKIITEYRLRLAVVSVFAIGALVTTSLVLFAPAYLLAVSKNTSAEVQLSALEKKYGDSKQEKEIAAQIRDVNTKILLLLGSDTSARLLPSEIISKILNIKGSSIKIFGITYDSTANQERIVLTGTATNRESLALFVEALKNDTAFTSVTMPISSYVKSANIDFSIVLDRKPKAPAKK